MSFGLTPTELLLAVIALEAVCGCLAVWVTGQRKPETLREFANLDPE